MKADFDSAKVNIGLGEVYFLLVQGHFFGGEVGFWVGLRARASFMRFASVMNCFRVLPVA